MRIILILFFVLIPLKSYAVTIDSPYIRGNMGVGTLTPQSKVSIVGNVGIGTIVYSPFIRNTAPVGGLATEGNIGIGTFLAISKLQVRGGVGIGTSDISTAISSTPDVALSPPGGGNVAYGYAFNPSPGTGNSRENRILSSGYGTLAGGFARDNGGCSHSILSSGSGSVALGYVGSNCTGAFTAQLSAIFRGSIAMGSVDAAGLSNDGFLQASGDGSIAFGRSAGASLTSSGIGSFAAGYANGSSGTVTLSASEKGAIAMGYSTGTLQATGVASVAVGQNIEALADNAIVFGKNLINNRPDTFAVGFSTNPPVLHVDSNNVGIGTFTTTSKLTISGGVAIVGSSSDSSYAGNLGLGTTLSTNRLDVQGGVGIGTSYAGYFSAPSNGMIVQGNIGIASSAPTQSLVIGTGSLQTVGIGTTVPQLPCIKANRVWGYYDPPWTGVCT